MNDRKPKQGKKHTVVFRGSEKEVQQKLAKWRRNNPDKTSKTWKYQDGSKWISSTTYWDKGRKA